MSFDGVFGYVSKVDFIKYLFVKIGAAFSKETWDPSNSFYKAYGIKGVYFSDLDKDINSAPLVVIQSYDLARLVASKQLAGTDINTEKAVEKKAQEISRNYLLEIGMSEDTIRFFDNLSKE